MNKIYKKKDKLIIEIPFKDERICPWTMENKGEMDHIIGLIKHGKDNTKCGLCYRIDMSYKGKDDQWTAPFYEYYETEEEFKKLCNELGIDCVEEEN